MNNLNRIYSNIADEKSIKPKHIYMLNPGKSDGKNVLFITGLSIDSQTKNVRVIREYIEKHPEHSIYVVGFRSHDKSNMKLAFEQDQNKSFTAQRLCYYTHVAEIKRRIRMMASADPKFAFDIIAGVSAGGMIATMLAQSIGCERLYLQAPHLANEIAHIPCNSIRIVWDVNDKKIPYNPDLVNQFMSSNPTNDNQIHLDATSGHMFDLNTLEMYLVPR